MKIKTQSNVFTGFYEKHSVLYTHNTYQLYFNGCNAYKTNLNAYLLKYVFSFSVFNNCKRCRKKYETHRTFYNDVI